MSHSGEPDFAWTADEIRRVGHRVVDLLAKHLTGLPEEPVFRPVPPELADQMRGAPIPLEGVSADRVIDQVAREILPHPFGNGHPRFYGWVNSPPAVMGVLGAALAAAMNPSVAGGNHAAVHLERQVIGWMRELMGFPPGSMGLLTSGASSAALTALAVARHVVCRSAGRDVRVAGLEGHSQQPSCPRLTVYQSSEGHGCHQKAIELLGLGSESLRKVPSDASLRMDPGALDALISEDVAAGHLPMAVIASAGTVNTGAIDPLNALADVAARHGVWLHVDGGYGGAALMTGAEETEREGLARAQSVAMDPHKWLYVPVDAGLVLVRDGRAMRDTFSLVPPYLRTDDDEHGVQGPPWLSEFGPEQTRPFRALKVWMAMRFFGVNGYRALIQRDMAFARALAERVAREPGLELWRPQGLSIVCFRVVPPESGRHPGVLDAINRRVLSSIQLGGEAFLSSTVLRGEFWLRACIVNPRAVPSDAGRLVDLVLRYARG